MIGSGQSSVTRSESASWHYDRESLLGLAHARLDRAFESAHHSKSQHLVKLVKLAGISWQSGSKPEPDSRADSESDELAATNYVLARVLQLVRLKSVQGETGQTSAVLRELGRVLCERSRSPIEYERVLFESIPSSPSVGHSGGKVQTWRVRVQVPHESTPSRSVDQYFDSARLNDDNISQ